MKIVVAVLGSPSLISLIVSVDVKQLEEEKQNKTTTKRKELSSIPLWLSSFSSKVVICGHCLVTLCRFWPSDLFFSFFKLKRP